MAGWAGACGKAEGRKAGMGRGTRPEEENRVSRKKVWRGTKEGSAKKGS